MAEEKVNADFKDVLIHCELFASLTHDDCELIAASCELRTITNGSILLAEGEAGNEMYVLIDGVLEVFKQVGGEEVILQRHEKSGAHLGEGALLKSGEDIRRASVRSLGDSQVLVVPKAVFMQAMQLNPAMEEHVNVVHHRQNKQLSLVEQSVMYRTLALFDQEHGWSREEHFEPGQVIVAEGDPPSAVYVVRSGSVKRSRMEDGEEVILSMLHEGQTFGGLAMLEDRPHSAAAIAVSAVELVTFDREQFLHATVSAPELREYLGAVNRVYAMSGGLVTVFDGEFRGQPAIVTVVNLDDGRDVIVNHVINRAIYSASLESPDDTECEDFIYRDDKREILRILTTCEGELLRVHVEGPWQELGQVHALLLDRTPVAREALQQFRDSGHLLEPSPEQLERRPEAILCQCLGLTRLTIESAMVHGAATLEDLSRETGATTVCGACTATIASMLSSTGQAVRVSKEIEVTPDVRSFRFTPCAESGADGAIGPEPLRSALPGQHVLVSAEIDGEWVQRPYTITSPPRCTEWREITVKREEHGYLSNWLFNQPQGAHLKLSHPKGDFWIDPKLRETVVCLVAGIGMTPALVIARSIDEEQSDQILHIDYSARTESDLVYRQELDELAARNDNISVNYRTTVFGSKLHDSVLGTVKVSSTGPSGGQRYLDLVAVQAIHTRLPGARYLICGPPGYMQAAQEMLLEVGVNPKRVQLEIFTPVGHERREIVPKLSMAKHLQLIVTLGFCVFYLIQNAFGWGLHSVVALQQIDSYRITTGSMLLAFIGYQWYLPYLRLTHKSAYVATQRHSYTGALAPVLLYLHSVSLGVAYTFVLSLLFLLNTMLGALDKTLAKNLRQREHYQRIWLMVHVPSSCLITVLALIHMVYALAYK
ncbi:MAG: cyclic nucleotide-binding domain-containing protein [Proteobacteria bacterium]|nr:cyclic nucleotide-binding domain-containing protein [Pseudomonadota bacterium]